MRECFDWLVKHEKYVVAANVVLVIALIVQIKFCNAKIKPEVNLPQSQAPTNQITPPSAPTTGIAGKWEMSVQKPKGGTQTWTLTLEQNGDSLKGIIKSEGGDLPVTGTIKGQSINLSAKKFGVTVEFPATLDAGIMNGTMRVLSVERQWTARRM